MSRDEYGQLLDHDYDGIQEYDNPLPGWWKWIFVGSIFFAIALLHLLPHRRPAPRASTRSTKPRWRRISRSSSRDWAITEADDATIVRLMDDDDDDDGHGGHVPGQLRAVPPGRRRRQHRPEPDRRLVQERAEAERHLQRDHQRRERHRACPRGSDGCASRSGSCSRRTSRRCAAPARRTPKAPEGQPIPPWPTLEELEARRRTRRRRRATAAARRKGRPGPRRCLCSDDRRAGSDVFSCGARA